MRIAIIGWGSLIWSPRELRLRSRWRDDGPCLPVEFARISNSRCLTLVILPGSVDQTTYWAWSELEDIKAARQNLCDREGSNLSSIHWRLPDGSASQDIHPNVGASIQCWLDDHREVDSVIWTGLPCNWMEKRGCNYSLDDALAYLQGLANNRGKDQDSHEKAQEYVRMTPSQIQPPSRPIIRQRLGWDDLQLGSDLFEKSNRERPDADL